MPQQGVGARAWGYVQVSPSDKWGWESMGDRRLFSRGGQIFQGGGANAYYLP